MLSDDLDLLQRCRHCYQRAYRIGGEYINKIRCRRCPLCGHSILGLGAIPEGLSADGWEICSNRRGKYRRRVFSDEELARMRP